MILLKLPCAFNDQFLLHADHYDITLTTADQNHFKEF